ncbi:MAG: porin [Planctomycetaceae bacterium]|nr:porin [Planctomycetaceae bacterium]
MPVLSFRQMARLALAAAGLACLPVADASAQLPARQPVYPTAFHFTEAGPAPVDLPPAAAPVETPAEMPTADAGCPTCAPAETTYESCAACSGEDDDCRFLEALFADNCGNNPLTDNGLYLNGWLSAGVMFNPDKPANGSNLPGPGFADRANDAMLNQFYLIFGRDAGADEDEFGIGFQMDFVAGNDAKFTKAAGWDDSWGSGDGGSDYFQYAMPQLYAELYAPVMEGLRVKVGHFYTIIGYEVVPATGNFFYTHAYTMQYGEPFTHTGVLGTLSVSENVDISLGVHNGWDDFEDEDANPYGLLGGITWTNDDDTLSVAWAMSYSEESNYLGTVNLPGGLTDLNTEADRYVQSLVVQAQLTEKLKYVVQSDYGVQSQGAVKLPNALGAPVLEDAQWYGLVNYLFYDLSDTLAAGVRYEWFHDDDGARVPNGQDLGTAGEVQGTFQSVQGTQFIRHGDYQALTFGLNWKPHSCITVRPEVRYDWSNVSREDSFVPTSGVYDDLGDDNQFTFGGDVILTY